MSSVFKKIWIYALPVCVGYVTIGLASGVLAAQAGIRWWQALLVSVTFYTGSGQFMMSSLALSGAPLMSIAANISLVSTRQILYSAAFSPFFATVPTPLAVLFAATVTDESFGVNMDRLQNDPEWSALYATVLNITCMWSWGLANALGCVIGEAADLPTNIMSFAMTSIFICLLVSQEKKFLFIASAMVSAFAVVLLKLAGLGSFSIFVGALLGIGTGIMLKGALGER